MQTMKFIDAAKGCILYRISSASRVDDNIVRKLDEQFIQPKFMVRRRQLIILNKSTS